jgi:hypothetical protein
VGKDKHGFYIGAPRRLYTCIRTLCREKGRRIDLVYFFIEFLYAKVLNQPASIYVLLKSCENIVLYLVRQMHILSVTEDEGSNI